MSYNPSSYKAMNDACVCFSARKAMRAVTQLYDTLLGPAGIRATQFTLLLMLAYAKGQTLTEMAEGLVMDRTTLTRNLRPLEKLGFIRTVKLADRRSKAYELSEAGQAAIEKAIPLWKQAQQQLIGKLGNERYQRFLQETDVVRSYANLPKSNRKKSESQFSALGG